MKQENKPKKIYRFTDVSFSARDDEEAMEKLKMFEENKKDLKNETRRK